MYAYIKGVITERNDQQIVVENNGIGYLINCPLGISAEIGGIGDEATVYLYQSVKEDDISLYGFNSRDQKEMFLKLITVSGIGPKVAHSICAALSAEQIAAAVMSNNVTVLTGVKGLGKKTAERIILELKDKKHKVNLEPLVNGADFKTDAILEHDKENIGFNHPLSKGRYCGHVAFADGHVEKIVMPQNQGNIKELTKWLCSGVDVVYDGGTYSEAN